MRNFSKTAAALAVMLTAAGCTNSTYADVVRFHGATPLSRGTISIVPLAPEATETLEFRTHAATAAEKLRQHGFEPATGAARYIATLGIEQADTPGPAKRSGVSVSVGGGFGIGNNAAVGASVPIGGKADPYSNRTITVSLRIRSAADQNNLWEGRASTAVSAGSAVASTNIAVPALLDALLRDFPGVSGQSTRVRLD